MTDRKLIVANPDVLARALHDADCGCGTYDEDEDPRYIEAVRAAARAVAPQVLPGSCGHRYEGIVEQPVTHVCIQPVGHVGWHRDGLLLWTTPEDVDCD